MPTVKSGKLRKKSSWFGDWRIRYLTLMPTKLFISSTPHIVSTPKVTYLQNVEVVDNKADHTNRQFFLYDKGVKFLFEAESEAEKKSWLAAITREITHTVPAEIKLPSGDSISLEIDENETAAGLIGRLKDQYLAIDDSIMILRHIGDWNILGLSQTTRIGENQKCVKLTPWYVYGPTKLEVITEKAAKLRLRLQHRCLITKAHGLLEGMSPAVRSLLTTSSRWNDNVTGSFASKSNGLSTIVRYMRESPEIYNGSFNYVDWSTVNEVLKNALAELETAIPIALEELKINPEINCLAVESAESLESVPTVTTSVCDAEECPLCYSTDKQTFRLAKCGHIFCAECLDALELRMPVCPHCRVDLIESISIEGQDSRSVSAAAREEWDLTSARLFLGRGSLSRPNSDLPMGNDATDFVDTPASPNPPGSQEFRALVDGISVSPMSGKQALTS